MLAAKADGGMPAALGGILCAGVALALIGLIIDRAGYRVIEFLLPPVVTGAIVALIGLNLAPVAKDQFSQQAGIALFTLAAILLATVALRGLPAEARASSSASPRATSSPRSSARSTGRRVHDADWVGFPDFTTPTFDGHAILLIVPAVVLVLIAENAAHVKAVAAMTERDLDPLIGRSIMADGAATTLAGAFGGVGTTTYAENIGVMGLTRVYSTLAYIIAGLIAIALALLPKFGAVISAIPVGVLGGAVTVLFGLIAVLGARIWIEANVDFRDPVNLATAAVALVVGAGNFTLHWGDYEFAGHRPRHARRGRSSTRSCARSAQERLPLPRPESQPRRPDERPRRPPSPGGR